MRDDRPHHRLVVRVAADVAHERAVDLDPLHRQPLEVAQRAVAGAEVVQRQADAARGQAAQGVGGCFFAAVEQQASVSSTSSQRPSRR